MNKLAIAICFSSFAVVACSDAPEGAMGSGGSGQGGSDGGMGGTGGEAEVTPTGDHLWSQRFGGSLDQFGRDVAADSAGNVVLCGIVAPGETDLGGGPLFSVGERDIVLAKYDAEGNHLWSHRYEWIHGQSGASSEANGRVVVDAFDNVFLTTTFGSWDTYLAKYDADGQPLWTRAIGTGQTRDMTTDGAGSVLLTGFFNDPDTPDFGGGPLSGAGQSDAFIVKIDANGEHLWSKALGGTGYDYGQAIAVGGEGHILVTGFFEGLADFGGGPLSSGESLAGFLAKLDGDGNHLWSTKLGEVEPFDYTNVATDGQGNVVATKTNVHFTDGDVEPVMTVASFDSAGAPLWSMTTDGAHEDDLTIDSSNHILITGGLLQGMVDLGAGPTGGENDSFIAKYDASGALIWAKTFYHSGIPAIAADPSDAVFVAGYFEGSLDLGGGPLISEDKDIFLAKLAP